MLTTTPGQPLLVQEATRLGHGGTGFHTRAAVKIILQMVANGRGTCSVRCSKSARGRHKRCRCCGALHRPQRPSTGDWTQSTVSYLVLFLNPEPSASPDNEQSLATPKASPLPQPQAQNLFGSIETSFKSSETSSDSTPEVKEGIQFYACCKHKLSRKEVRAMHEAAFLVLCVHGRDDVIVALKYGRKVAALLKVPLVVLEAGHDLLGECGHQVCVFIVA